MLILKGTRLERVNKVMKLDGRVERGQECFEGNECVKKADGVTMMPPDNETLNLNTKWCEVYTMVMSWKNEDRT